MSILKPNYVFVLDTKHKPLTPCKPWLARKLLKVGKAKVFRLYPFTIILRKKVTEDPRPMILKIDPGSKCLIAVWKNDATVGGRSKPLQNQLFPILKFFNLKWYNLLFGHPCDRLSFNYCKMFVNDCWNFCRCNAAVASFVRHHNYIWARFALFKTSGSLNSHLVF